MRFKKNRGVTMAIAFIVGVILIILIVLVLQLVSLNTRQTVYLSQMNRTHRLAETGLNDALGRLAINPTNMNTYTTTISGEGDFKNVIGIRNSPIVGVYYIQTTATRNVGVKTYSSILHTYARVSNVSQYFAATNTSLSISQGVNALGGKVYAPKVDFLPGGGPPTFVASVEYVDPAYTGMGGGISPDPITSPGSYAWGAGPIQITNPATHLPVMLKAPMLFPQVLQTDIDTYRNVYNGGLHLQCDFRNNWPASLLDGYQHITPPSAADHVYYCAGGGPMLVQGIIHGQITFVSEGDIYISSGVINVDNTVFNPLVDPSLRNYMPAGSVAHQAVFVTRNNVYIRNTYYTAALVPISAPDTQIIEGLIMAPNGRLQADAYGSPPLAVDPNNPINIVNPSLTGLYSRLALNFNGSIIVQSITGGPGCVNCISNVFRAGRTLSYMTSLGNPATAPVPPIPAITEIIDSVEQVQ